MEIEGKPDWVKCVRAKFRGQEVQVKMLADNAGPEYKRQFQHGKPHSLAPINPRIREPLFLLRTVFLPLPLTRKPT